ncbi:S8 family serine peptidase [Aquella oligotrophica]|uniref:Peptidase S8/S53 domain-containing protein n=1 Tax=Aquella oligotrophica TaxID=2067065 RepID=A0A2I7N389_9NEIS|nr:S8 family serine peptidase [Aquella oligotrophica]AUR50919.1 hypothetical protein CUN60_00905 [Aquella oligotrophica]
MLTRLNKQANGKFKMGLLLGVLTATIYAETGTSNNQIILRYEPTAEQQKFINSAKNLQEKNQDIKQVKAKLMEKLSTAKLQALSAVAGQQVVDFGPYALGGRVLTFKKNLTPTEMAQVISRLKKIPGVANVEENVILSADEVVSLNREQWELFDVSAYDGAKSIVRPFGTKLYGAGFYSDGSFHGSGSGVTVAVVDSGYTPHPNFISHLQPLPDNKGYGYTFISDCSNAGTCPATQTESLAILPYPDALDLGGATKNKWHGTGVIGTIIGQHINAEANRGGAPASRVVPVRVLGKNGGTMSDLLAAIEWAGGIHPIPNSNPAKVINVSMSGPATVCSTELQRVFNELDEAKVTVVVTAGNTSENYTTREPANCKDTNRNVITVAALGSVDYLVDYSSAGKVTIAAPGGDDSTDIVHGLGILSTSYSGNKYGDCNGNQCFIYKPYKGTSFAAPLVTAAIADILAIKPNLTPEQIVKILRDSASPIQENGKCTKKICVVDAGRLNVAAALKLAETYNN